MKITIINGKVTAEAENHQDRIDLMAYLNKSTEVRATKKHKKHNFLKPCSLCGKMVKGVAGQAIHYAYMHKPLHDFT